MNFKKLLLFVSFLSLPITLCKDPYRGLTQAEFEELKQNHPKFMANILPALDNPAWLDSGAYWFEDTILEKMKQLTPEQARNFAKLKNKNSITFQELANQYKSLGNVWQKATCYFENLEKKQLTTSQVNNSNTMIFENYGLSSDEYSQLKQELGDTKLKTITDYLPLSSVAEIETDVKSNQGAREFYHYWYITEKNAPLLASMKACDTCPTFGQVVEQSPYLATIFPKIVAARKEQERLEMNQKIEQIQTEVVTLQTHVSEVILLQKKINEPVPPSPSITEVLYEQGNEYFTNHQVVTNHFLKRLYKEFKN